MKNIDPVPVLIVVLGVTITICVAMVQIFGPSDSHLSDEVQSLRDDLNQLTIVVSELDKAN